MFTSNGNFQQNRDDSSDSVSLLIEDTEYRVLIWVFLTQHKHKQLRRNEKHLRVLDAISDIDMLARSRAVLKISDDLIIPFYTTLLVASHEGIESLIAANMPLCSIQSTASAIQALLSAIEPAYLKKIFERDKNDQN